MNLLIPKKSDMIIYIGIIWLFHICGMIGISYGNKDFFLAFTPVNLFISFVLLIINQNQLETNELKTIGIIFLLGMVCEILGVNYGLIFGDYVYLDNLGFKILGVPILIGFNWIILTLITGSLSSLLSSNIYYSVLCGAIFMIILDLLIEPVAPLLGFWVFDNEQVPVQNYIGWFVIGVVTQYLFQKYFKDKEFTFSLHLLAANTIFFLFLNLQS